MKICFICHANICRSFISQELLKDLLKKNNKHDIEVISRGLYVLPYVKVPEKIKNFLLKNNIIYNEHTPIQYCKQDIISSDLVFVMTKEQYEEITDTYSEFIDKIYLLMDFVLNEKRDIEDPISLKDKKFEKSVNTLKNIIYKLYDKLEFV